jgi:hypothetical protein
MNRILFFFSCLLFGISVQAQTISLVKQINTSWTAFPITEYKECSGALYLAAGHDLWKTDGTTGNTTLMHIQDGIE